MSVPQNFRSAFNGFNREDVVHYLEYINNKHTAQVNQLEEENAALRARLSAAGAQRGKAFSKAEGMRRVEEYLLHCLTEKRGKPWNIT